MTQETSGNNQRLRIREPAVGIMLELPKQVLLGIRNDGVYDEITIDPTNGRILGQVHLVGRYDSYSDTYHLNGGQWRITGHRSWPSGEDTYVLKLEEQWQTSRVSSRN